MRIVKPSAIIKQGWLRESDTIELTDDEWDAIVNGYSWRIGKSPSQYLKELITLNMTQEIKS
jgi:hypothetical protein